MPLLTKLEEKEIEWAHLNLDLNSIDFARLRDPFEKYHSVDNYIEVLKAIRDPKNFYFTCKYIFNVDPTVFQLVLLETLWNYPFPMFIANRGASKTFTSALYCMIRALITQGCKIVIASATFRQAKYVFEYMENIWHNAPVLQDLCGNDKKQGPVRGTDTWTFRIGTSTITAIPLGTGEKIRGLRAQVVLVEEFNSVNEDIFEIVLRGFTATSSNPQENIKNFARIKKLKEKDRWTPEQEAKIFYKPNQIILSGTAGFEFQHFAKYWKRYHGIITSNGDPQKLQDVLGVNPGKGFSHKDYCVIRIPHDLLPEGMMEEKAVENSRATMDKGRFDCEFNAIFSKDSAGFFRRSLIENCTTIEPIQLPSGQIQFYPRLFGDQACKYVMGIDPASESDNFAISIVEVYSDHIRLVYSWTTTRKKAFKAFTDKKANENSFYAFITRKIRNLMKIFQIEYIGLDAGGGGVAVLENLRDNRHLEAGEIPIHPLRQDDSMLFPKSKDYGYDDEPGLHIIDMINFGNVDWIVEANHGLKKSLESRTFLFPHFDSLSFTVASVEDEETQREIDTLEDVIYEIEQTKEELSCIVHTTTLNGRDQWLTPELVLQGGKKGRMRKDRYSALLIAYSIAARMLRPSRSTYTGSAGGFAGEYRDKVVDNNKLYTGADWFISGANKSQAFGNFRQKDTPHDPFKVFNW